MKIKLISFMFVGGIGFLINLGIYYPLTLIFKQETVVFGQQYYLPPFLISTAIAITCNYYLNRKFTFGDSKVKSLSLIKYAGTCWITIPIEVALLIMFVEILGINNVVSVGLAVLTVFLSRYFMVKEFVWNKAYSKQAN